MEKNYFEMINTESNHFGFMIEYKSKAETEILYLQENKEDLT